VDNSWKLVAVSTAAGDSTSRAQHDVVDALDADAVLRRRARRLARWRRVDVEAVEVGGDLRGVLVILR
jgi:hypothetical protein